MLKKEEPEHITHSSPSECDVAGCRTKPTLGAVWQELGKVLFP